MLIRFAKCCRSFGIFLYLAPQTHLFIIAYLVGLYLGIGHVRLVMLLGNNNPRRLKSLSWENPIELYDFQINSGRILLHNLESLHLQIGCVEAILLTTK